MGHGILSERVIRHHPFIAYAREMKAICQPLAKLSIHVFGYFRAYPDQSFAGLINYPEWGECYLKQGYFQYEDYLKHPMFFQDGYEIWNHQAKQRHISDKRLREMKRLQWADVRAFHMHNGIVVTKTLPEWGEIYHFATTETNDRIKLFFVEHVDLLDKFIAYFRSVVRSDHRLLAACQRKTPLLDTANFLSDVTFFDTDTPLHAFMSDRQAYLDAIRLTRYYLQPPLETVYLTAKEVACVRLCLSGQRINTIARSLGIGEKTVDTHLSHVREKVNCHSLTSLMKCLRHESWLHTTEKLTLRYL